MIKELPTPSEVAQALVVYACATVLYMLTVDKLTDTTMFRELLAAQGDMVRAGTRPRPVAPKVASPHEIVVRNCRQSRTKFSPEMPPDVTSRPGLEGRIVPELGTYTLLRGNQGSGTTTLAHKVALAKQEAGWLVKQVSLGPSMTTKEGVAQAVVEELAGPGYLAPARSKCMAMARESLVALRSFDEGDRPPLVVMTLSNGVKPDEPVERLQRVAAEAAAAALCKDSHVIVDTSAIGGGSAAEHPRSCRELRVGDFCEAAFGSYVTQLLQDHSLDATPGRRRRLNEWFYAQVRQVTANPKELQLLKELVLEFDDRGPGEPAKAMLAALQSRRELEVVKHRRARPQDTSLVLHLASKPGGELLSTLRSRGLVNQAQVTAIEDGSMAAHRCVLVETDARSRCRLRLRAHATAAFVLRTLSTQRAASRPVAATLTTVTRTVTRNAQSSWRWWNPTTWF